MKASLWSSAFCLAIALAMFVMAGSCAQKQENPSVHPLKESYYLMDHGENSKAIMLLEKVVADDPENVEARVLLASAYAGKAGINIYTLHDAFNDILFSKSLSDSLWNQEEKKSGSNGSLGVDLPAPDKSLRDAPLEQLIDRLDHMLDSVRRTMLLLNRFPKVEEQNWPLLENALALLDPMLFKKDVGFYRLFLRIVYLKEYLNRRILGDERFGKHDWLCKLDFDKFYDGLRWMNEQLKLASSDFKSVFPDKGSSIEKVHAVMAETQLTLDEFRDKSPPGSESFMSALQARTRKAIRCVDSE